MNINKSEKLELFESIILRYLFSSYHRLSLFHMANKMILNEKGVKTIYQSQVKYILDHELKF